MGDSAAKITKPAETRSNKGCWTCRLRKKKCDEHRPGCLRCASAGIECNFGSKPDWFGDEAKSRRKLAHIKLLVKGSAARKRAVTVAAKHESAVAVSPVEQSHAGEAAGTSPRRSIGKLALQDSTTAASSSRAWLWPQLVDNQEADLIMHYLDFVFFIQFRFYQPSIARGGRGWLLTLLTYTKPLYHAALSLSAFHQQSLLCHERRQPQDHIRILDELKHHHELTLKELQLFIQAHNEEGESSAIFEGCIQILACMVELISFEVSLRYRPKYSNLTPATALPRRCECLADPSPCCYTPRAKTAFHMGGRSTEEKCRRLFNRCDCLVRYPRMHINGFSSSSCWGNTSFTWSQ